MWVGFRLFSWFSRIFRVRLRDSVSELVKKMGMTTKTTRMFEVRVDPDLLNRKILHGYMPLTDTKTLLSKEGDYLLRLTDCEGINIV